METSIPVVGFPNSQEFQIANLAFDCDCSNAFSCRDVIFVVFLKLFKFRYKKFHKICGSNLYNEALSRYSQELRVLPPNMTAQILVVFEI